MFDEFIADIMKQDDEEKEQISINLAHCLDQSGLLIEKLKGIDVMSEKETYSILKESYSDILSDLFVCKRRDCKFLLSNAKFLSILTQVISEVVLSNDERVHCNKFIYEYIVYENKDEYIRKLLFLLGYAVNQITTNKLLGCDLDKELSIFLAVAYKSHFNDDINITRVNFTLATSIPQLSIQKVIQIYEALFADGYGFGKVFITTMFDINITSGYGDEDWITSEVYNANENITCANLYILESMEPISITRTLLLYSEAFKLVHSCDYRSVRVSLRDLPKSFIKTPIIIQQLEGDEDLHIVIP